MLRLVKRCVIAFIIEVMALISSAYADDIYGTPGKSITVSFQIFNGTTGAPCVGCPITFTAAPAATNTGYHYHSPVGRPRPQVLLSSGRTDGQGFARTTVLLPFYAGRYPITACSVVTVNFCDVQPVVARDGFYNEIGTGTGYSKYTDLGHAYSGFTFGFSLDSLTQSCLRTIMGLFSSYSNGHVIAVARGSLPWGGWNDTDVLGLGRWYSTSNDDHRFAASFDIFPPVLLIDAGYIDKAVATTKGAGGLPCEISPLNNGLDHIWCE